MTNPLHHPQEIYEFLHDIDAGAVLDIATGVGQFVSILSDCLGSYSEIIGVDTHAQAIDLAARQVTAAGAEFRIADATALPFLSGRFDTVAISNSLHHMEKLSEVLAEMRRVTASNGRWIIFEMHADAPNQASKNAIDLHLWAAAADRAMGRFHEPVLTRTELLDAIQDLELSDLRMIDWHSEEEPSPEQIAGSVQAIENVRKQVIETKHGASLAATADELIERIRCQGIQSQPFLLATGLLPGP